MHLSFVESGNALLIYSGECQELNKGDNICIPAPEQHIFKIIEDFKAYVVMPNDAQIKYPDA